MPFSIGFSGSAGLFIFIYVTVAKRDVFLRPTYLLATLLLLTAFFGIGGGIILFYPLPRYDSILLEGIYFVFREALFFVISAAALAIWAGDKLGKTPNSALSTVAASGLHAMGYSALCAGGALMILVIIKLTFFGDYTEFRKCMSRLHDPITCAAEPFF
jgi:hypothetical protein